ncbi:hypothetical protein AN219_08030 [Streptomyces nanshensis]|nr:hypothetical protein AN219_08030 [Streptomyces nanshensis]
MEPLRLDDPRNLGDYVPIGRVDAPDSEVPLPVRRFVARGAGGGRTVLISVPLAELAGDHEYGERFAAEAETARRLGAEARLPWTAQVMESSRLPGGPPWYTTPYVPALPLPGVLAAHGGGLPERTLRALGLGLAEALTELHARGAVHAGVSPGALLVAADGPLLTAYGAMRALVPGTGHFAHRPSLAGLPERGGVPPEQLSGGTPGPPGDVHALGAVLCYAASGLDGADSSRVPASMRTLVAACLSEAPGDRPQAAVVRDELRTGAAALPVTSGPPPVPVAAQRRGPVSAPAPVPWSAGGAAGGTVLDSAASAFGPGWLPARVIAAIARQSACALGAALPA